MSTYCLSLRGPVLALASTLALAAFFLAGPTARGQMRTNSGIPAPRLMAVSPAGGKVGSAVTISLGGLNLEEPEKLVFSHPGIKSEVISTSAAPEPDPKTKEKGKGRGKRGMGASTPGVVKFEVTIPADVPLGVHDVRVVNKWGVSNPRAFVVGDLNEIEEKEPNSDDTQAQRFELNTTINGAIGQPTDVDYFVFAGKKGQRVVLHCRASSVDSRVQPAVEVYDGKGKQLAHNRDYKDNDAVTDCVLPADGDYQVRLYQFTHTFPQPIPLPGAIPTGLSDNFYRLTVSTAPWIDAIFPPVLEPGKSTPVTVWGRNLPGGKPDPTAVVDDSVLDKVTVNVTAPGTPEAQTRLAYSDYQPPQTAAVDGFEFRLRNETGSSNPFLLTYARFPLVLDGASNDSADKAQAVTVPCEVAGRVEKRRDRDWFSFTAKKGETFYIEVESDRLGAPTYMYLVVRNPATKSEVYESPLNETGRNIYSRKFFARSEDPPSYQFTAPADGTYQVLVANRSADTTGGYGPRHLYRLRIARAQNDFRLVALSAAYFVPDTVSVPAGGGDAFTVLAFREEGFTGDIELTLEGLPAGLSCPPQTLNGSVRQTTMAVTATPGAAPWAGVVKVKGTAVVNGAKVTREARAASIVWPVQAQDNVISPSRVDRELYLTVRGKAFFSLAASVDKPTVAQGDKANLKVVHERLAADFKTPLQVTLLPSQQSMTAEFPANLRINNNQPLTLNPGQKEGTLPITVGADVPPGTYNVVLRGQGQTPYSKDPMAKTKPPTNVVHTSNPVTLTVLPKSLATLTVSSNGPTVKVGGQAELTVRVARKFNYDGAFKVTLELPAGVTGVSAKEVTIPAGADEAKLTLVVPAGTPPGNKGNLTVKAVALFQGKVPTSHEAKINVNIVK